MSAIQKLAAALARKGIDAATGRKDPPAVAPPIPPPLPTSSRGPKGGGKRRARYSASQHELVRLEGQWRAANRRAEKAESALAAALQRIATMESENERLRNQARG